MKAFAYINKNGQEIICQGTPFKYLDAVLKQEKLGNLPKGLYSSKDSIDAHDEWCNSWSEGNYSVPTLVGVIVPNGTLKKLGIEYNGKPIELLFSPKDYIKENNRIIERLIRAISDDIPLSTGEAFDCLSWLKSIKDRVQPKQEWSEEDENMLKSIIATCKLAEQDRDSSPARHLLEMQDNWLKSLKERLKGE